MASLAIAFEGCVPTPKSRSPKDHFVPPQTPQNGTLSLPKLCFSLLVPGQFFPVPRLEILGPSQEIFRDINGDIKDILGT